MGWIYKENVTQEEIDRLHPDFGIYKNVIFDDVKYYRDDDTVDLWEVNTCYNDT